MRPPSPLRPADLVHAVLPAGPADVAKFDAGVARLERAGFRVRQGEGAKLRRHRYLAGTDDERLAELAGAYRDPDVRAVWAGRGGYGTMRLLRRLEPVIAAAPPKLLVGFSDITALGCLLWRGGVPWLHGPVLTTLAAEPDASVEHLLAVAAGRGAGRTLAGTATIRPGTAAGPLVGGNLALLAALAGTPYLPDLGGAILFLEDVGELPRRLDRMLLQLRLSGALDRVAGVALGQLTRCDADDHAGLDVMRELVAELGVPAACGFAFGHDVPNLALPVGAAGRLEAGDPPRLRIESEIVA